MNDINELKNKIFNENCISDNPNEGMNRIPDKSIDMILCDLPYGTTQCKWDIIIPFDKLWEQYKRIIKDNGAIALFAQTPFDKVLGYSNLKMLRYEWIWDKDKGGGFLNAKRIPLRQHENILIFYKKQPTYNPQMKVAKTDRIRPLRKNTKQNSNNYGEVKKGVEGKSNIDKRYPTSIIEFSMMEGECNPKHRLHPTQKPVELLAYLIKTYSNKGDIILDNCCGAGSMGVACIKTDRNYIMFDNGKCDKKGDSYGKYWADISQNRIDTYLKLKTK